MGVPNFELNKKHNFFTLDNVFIESQSTQNRVIYGIAHRANNLHDCAGTHALLSKISKIISHKCSGISLMQS